MTSWNSPFPKSPLPLPSAKTAQSLPSSHPLKKYGAHLAVLRTRKGLSRKKLLSRLSNEIENDESFYERVIGNDDSFLEKVTESLLKRIEMGQVIKLNRKMVEVFVRALDCTSSERHQLLILADLNPFADSQGNMSAVDMTLIAAFLRLKDHPVVNDLVGQALSESHSSIIPDERLIQLLAEIVAHMQ